MANIEAQIKPNGLSQRNLVDLLFQIIYSLKGIAAKMDDDGGVTLTTYEANAYTAIFNGSITDSKGNMLINAVSTAPDRFFIITPTGIDDKSLNECLYQIFDMMETLTEQCDTDSLTGSDFESLCYTAYFTYIIENCKGSQLGNGTTYYFRPGGMFNQKELVNLLYNIVYAMSIFTAKLDDDGTVTDTTYESLWYTATILMRVENSQGSVIGNSITITP